MKRRPNPDPRVVGGTYWSSYWNANYTVLHVDHSDRYTTWYRVRWDDGLTTQHCTTWDSRDRVVNPS